VRAYVESEEEMELEGKNSFWVASFAQTKEKMRQA
jgi:hypothetical protein